MHHVPVLASLLATVVTTAHAGPIDPPAGPVAPTMKTLEEVEPRIAINQANTPGDSDSAFKITAAGSYYLPQNYIILGFLNPINGIEIAAGNVTIDLNGFTISGGSNAIDGVVFNGNPNNVTIKNGTVSSFDNHAINIGSDGNQVILEDLKS